MHERRKARFSNLFPVFLTYFLDNFGLAIIYPIFTPLLLNTNHPFIATTTPYFQRTLLLGLLISSFPLAQFFSAPLIGQISDRFGRKRSFLFTILGTSIGYFLTALSILEHSLIFLFISRFLTGLFAGNLTLCLASIADTSPDEKTRARNFGQIAAMGGLSFISAIALGGLFSNPAVSPNFHPSFPFWFIGSLSFFNLISMFFFFHETHSPMAHPKLNPFKGVHHILSALKTKQLKTLYITNFLFMLAWVGSMQFLPTYLFDRFLFSNLEVTLSLMWVGVLWFFSNLFINRFLSKHFYSGQTLLLCLLLLATFLLSTFFIRSPIPFFFLFSPAICTAALSWTNSLATVSLRSPLEMQGSILGINQSITSLAAVTSPILGGALAGISSNTLYIFSGFVSLAAFLILFSSKVYLPFRK